MKFGQIAAPLAALATAACSTSMAPCPLPLAGDAPVYVVSRGWHVDVGIPADQLDGPLAVYRDVFPGARTVMFGFGKKTFITAPADTISEYLLGPVPGPAVIQVTALSVAPPDAYPPGTTLTLSLPPGGSEALSAYIWNELGKNPAGGPRLVSEGRNPVSLFYAARDGYSLFHTCNTWAANALHAAGLPVSGGGVVLSGQVMARSERAASRQCVPPVVTAAARPS